MNLLDFESNTTTNALHFARKGREPASLFLEEAIFFEPGDLVREEMLLNGPVFC